MAGLVTLGSWAVRDDCMPFGFGFGSDGEQASAEALLASSGSY